MWTRENLVRIDLTGRINRIICNVCGNCEAVRQTDEFVPGKLAKSPKQQLRRFIDEHFDMHVTQAKKAEAAP